MSNRFAGDLKFVGLSQDGEHLIVVAPSGDEFRLRVTPMVRAAVRLDRSAMEAAKADHEGTLPPREIQTQIRAGRTAQEISDSAHVPLELVQRYEGPVLAERAYMAEQAQKTTLSAEPGSPTLGEITIDRLAARGVNTLDIIWDAYKTAGHGWIVSVTFDVDSDIRVARWTYKASTKSITAIDDDARWLSETRIADEPIPRRHLSAVRGEVFDFEKDSGEPTRPDSSMVDTSQVHTEALLERLNSARGTRKHSGYPIGSSAVSPVQANNVVALSGRSGDGQEDTDLVFDAVSPASTVGDENAQASIETGRHSAPTSSSANSAPDGSNVIAQSDTAVRASRSIGNALTPSESHSETINENAGIVSPEHVVNGRSQWAPHDSQITPMTSALSALSSAGGTPTEQNEQVHGTDLFGEDMSAKQANQQTKKPRANGRNPMPTWDEIMFGAKPE